MLCHIDVCQVLKGMGLSDLQESQANYIDYPNKQSVTLHNKNLYHYAQI